MSTRQHLPGIYLRVATGLALVGLVMGCKGASSVPTPVTLPTVAPPTVALPTVELPWDSSGFHANNCLEEQQLVPHLCGIVPGNTTMVEVQERVKREPVEIRTGEACSYLFVAAPNAESADACWNYSYTTPLRILFDNEVVIALDVGFSPAELTLGRLVEVFGPPERVIFVLETGVDTPGWGEDTRRADWAFFLWAEQGTYISTVLYGTTGVSLDASDPVPPLPAGLPIDVMTAFEPCSKEELEAFFVEWFPPGEWVRWADWPGMIE